MSQLMKNAELTHSISVVLLAAGQSLRMGNRNKLLLPYRNATILEATLSAFLPQKFSEIFVVIGHEAPAIAAILQNYSVKTVVNEDYRSGMGTSVVTGVAATTTHSRGILISPADLPLLTSDTVEILCQTFHNHQPPVIVYPTYQNQQGHPVIFSAGFRPELLQLSGDRGAKGIIRKNRERCIAVEVASEEILFDLDTLEKYHELLQKRR